MNTSKPRKTLIQLTSETQVRDPAAHAKLQVSELDKTAKRSQVKRKECNEAIEADNKELLHIEEQIRRIKKSYDPLCEHLNEAYERKKNLIETLEKCLLEEKKIMGNTKNVIQERRTEESKMNKKMSTLDLELVRGYNLKPESTYYQSNPSAYSPTNTMKSVNKK